MNFILLLLLFCCVQTRIAAELTVTSRRPDDYHTGYHTAAPTTSTTTTLQPATWIPPSGSVGLLNGTYFFNRVWLNWTSAREHCQSLGMDLVAIETEEENTLLTERAKIILGDFWTPWTSGCYSRTEDAVVWRSTGRNITYSNWGIGAGNLRDVRRCVWLHPTDGRWNGYSSSGELPSICERL